MTLRGSNEATVSISGSNNDDTLIDIENITGGSAGDHLTGDSRANVLQGMGGSDTLDGGSGNDLLRGGAGKDWLTGGTGYDDFVFLVASHSAPGPATCDVITRFVRGYDDIVVSSIDAKAGLTGNQAFALDTNGSFSRGEIRQTVSSTGLLVEFNTDSDATAEMAILIQEMTSRLGATDFVL